jgi:hypothetical protein
MSWGKLASAARRRSKNNIERWSRFPGQNGGLAKVVSGFDYAASFSCSLSIA